MSPPQGWRRRFLDFLGSIPQLIITLVAVAILVTVICAAREHKHTLAARPARPAASSPAASTRTTDSFGALDPRAPVGSVNSTDAAAAPRDSSRDELAIIGHWAERVLGTAAVLGVLAMVLIQSFKVRLRRGFHRVSLQRFFADGLRASEKSENRAAVPTTYAHPDKHYGGFTGPAADVFRRVAPSYPFDILACPIEQLAAQLASAADIALSRPKDNAGLLWALAGEDGAKMVEEHLRLADLPIGISTDELFASRQGLSNTIQRRLDGFQVHAGNLWRSDLRLFAVLVSGGLAALGVMVFSDWQKEFACTTLAFVLVVGLLGGLLASIARDLVAVVERLRR